MQLFNQLKTELDKITHLQINYKFENDEIIIWYRNLILINLVISNDFVYLFKINQDSQTCYKFENFDIHFILNKFLQKC